MPIRKVFEIDSSNNKILSFQKCSDGLFIDVKGNTFEILNYHECNLLIDFLKEISDSLKENEVI